MWLISIGRFLLVHSVRIHVEDVRLSQDFCDDGFSIIRYCGRMFCKSSRTPPLRVPATSLKSLSFPQLLFLEVLVFLKILRGIICYSQRRRNWVRTWQIYVTTNFGLKDIDLSNEVPLPPWERHKCQDFPITVRYLFSEDSSYLFLWLSLLRSVETKYFN